MNTNHICKRCLSAFTPTSSQAAKSDYRCKSCCASDARAYRAKRTAAGNPIARAPRAPLSEQGRGLQRAYDKRRYHADPVRRAKQNVRSIARNAVLRGKLTRQPCEVCGATPVEAHHDDYSQPLNVRWLCPSHHRQHHAGV